MKAQHCASSTKFRVSLQEAELAPVP
jgi:hypothetical protein